MQKERGYASLGAPHEAYGIHRNRLNRHPLSPSQIECLDQSPSKCRRQSRSAVATVAEERKRAKAYLPSYQSKDEKFTHHGHSSRWWAGAGRLGMLLVGLCDAPPSLPTKDLLIWVQYRARESERVVLRVARSCALFRARRAVQPLAQKPSLRIRSHVGNFDRLSLKLQTLRFFLTMTILHHRV